jgi:hypothetical protein
MAGMVTYNLHLVIHDGGPRAGEQVGGIQITNGGSLDMNGSVLRNNTGQLGGAIAVMEGCSLKLTSTALLNNTAENGAGIAHQK